MSDMSKSRGATESRHWSTICPQNAVDIILPREDITGPVNEQGEACPWPWQPQQLVGAAMGQYHCAYCGAMSIAGLPHPDYANEEAD